MQKISRATDTVWATAAFDPRKPVDPDWANKPLSPVLRSGDERRLLRGSPGEHDHSGDAMGWSPDPPTAADYADPDSEQYDPYTDPGYHEGGDVFSSHDVPAHDLRAMDRHRRDIMSNGRIEGNDPSMVVQSYGDSNVNHYYNYNPSDDSQNPWKLTTTHWSLQDPMESRHPDFESAANEAKNDKNYLEDLGV